MFLAELRINNFRIYGEDANALVLPLRPGLTAIVGENDSGKTAVINALRLVLGTRDQEFFRVNENDFHQPPGGLERRKEIRIRCKLAGLAPADRSTFVEYLTYEGPEGGKTAVLCLTWRAERLVRPQTGRRLISVDLRSGKDGDGPALDFEARQLLCATYLRPLRDAQRAMSSGRSSRLSQILQHTKEINENGVDYDKKNAPRPDPNTLSVLGIGDYADALLADHQGIKKARENLNAEYLRHLSFTGSVLQGTISVGGARGDDANRLRLLLDKLDLALSDASGQQSSPNPGLGSNNLLFMACELLLLGAEGDGFPLLLIEEPEAHLHPQRQLRLMRFLQQKAQEPRKDGQAIQIIVTTQSSILASAIEIENLVLLQGGRAFPLDHGNTELEESDYRFLKRFLDATKANLFFARGVLIVEGDAENILFPTLATLLDRNLTENGVSTVNVGGVGLRRYARIYLRKNPAQGGTIDVPVACVADMDVMPNCAPSITGLVAEGSEWPNPGKRRWRAKRDLTPAALLKRREEIAEKANGQNVKTFVADEWTLEYDLAFAGLDEEVWVAASLARVDEKISSGASTVASEVENAQRAFDELKKPGRTKEEIASHAVALFVSGRRASKAVAAQYLAERLLSLRESGALDATTLRARLPAYVVAAIEYVTRRSGASAPNANPAEPDPGD